MGIFDLLQGGEALGDFDDEDAAQGFEGVVVVFAFFEFGVVFGGAVKPFDVFAGA